MGPGEHYPFHVQSPVSSGFASCLPAEEPYLSSPTAATARWFADHVGGSCGDGHEHLWGQHPSDFCSASSDASSQLLLSQYLDFPPKYCERPGDRRVQDPLQLWGVLAREGNSFHQRKGLSRLPQQLPPLPSFSDPSRNLLTGRASEGADAAVHSWPPEEAWGVQLPGAQEVDSGGDVLLEELLLDPHMADGEQSNTRACTLLPAGGSYESAAPDLILPVLSGVSSMSGFSDHRDSAGCIAGDEAAQSLLPRVEPLWGSGCRVDVRESRPSCGAVVVDGCEQEPVRAGGPMRLDDAAEGSEWLAALLCDLESEHPSTAAIAISRGAESEQCGEGSSLQLAAEHDPASAGCQVAACSGLSQDPDRGGRVQRATCRPQDSTELSESGACQFQASVHTSATQPDQDEVHAESRKIASGQVATIGSATLGGGAESHETRSPAGGPLSNLRPPAKRARGLPPSTEGACRPPDLTARLAGLVRTGRSGQQLLLPGRPNLLAHDVSATRAAELAGLRPMGIRLPGRKVPSPQPAGDLTWLSGFHISKLVAHPRAMPAANRESGLCLSTPEETYGRLLAYAEATATDDQPRVRVLGRRLKEEADQEGTVMQRVAYYFLQGFRARAAGAFTGAVTQRELTQADGKAATLEYTARIPIYHLSILGVLCPLSIAVGNYPRVHIIDFTIWRGGHLLHLIRTMRNKAASLTTPLHLRITALDLGGSAAATLGGGPAPCSFFKQQDVLDVLRPAAEEVGVALEYGVVEVERAEDLRPEDFAVRADERLAICCGFRLQYVSDMRVGPMRRSPRDALLECFRQLRPEVLALVDTEADLSTDFYLQRVRRCLDFYTTHFDAHAPVYTAGPCRPRVDLEGAFLGRDIVNTVAAEGASRVHRPEGAARVAARMRRVGFESYSLSREDLSGIFSWYLPKFACGWTAEAACGEAKLRWKGHALVSLTCWRAGPSPDAASDGGDKKDFRWLCHFHLENPCTCPASRRGFFLDR